MYENVYNGTLQWHGGGTRNIKLDGKSWIDTSPKYKVNNVARQKN